MSIMDIKIIRLIRVIKQTTITTGANHQLCKQKPYSQIKIYQHSTTLWITLAFHLHFICISFAFHLHFICILIAFHLHFNSIYLLLTTLRTRQGTTGLGLVRGCSKYSPHITTSTTSPSLMRPYFLVPGLRISVHRPSRYWIVWPGAGDK